MITLAVTLSALLRLPVLVGVAGFLAGYLARSSPRFLPARTVCLCVSVLASHLRRSPRWPPVCRCGAGWGWWHP